MSRTGMSAYREEEGTHRQVWWDNSSLSVLRTCARKYYYQIVLGLRPKGDNPHLIFGLLYHGALEYHDRLVSDGVRDPSIRARAVMRKVLADSWDWKSEHKTKHRESLVRAVLGYIDHFKQDAVKTLALANGAPAVELSFRFEIDLTNPWGDPYGLCGHLDRIGELDGGLYVIDRKTTSKAFQYEYIQKYKPSGQMLSIRLVHEWGSIPR